MPRLSCRPKGEPGAGQGSWGLKQLAFHDSGKLPSQPSQDEDAGQVGVCIFLFLHTLGIFLSNL